MRTIPILLLFVAVGCKGMEKVVINEIMPKNLTGLEDNGSHPDWVELYNKGGKTIELAGWYLSDDRSDPFKWMIPDGVEIEGRSHLVIIADSDPEEGVLHATFNLSEEGEDVVLTGPDDSDNLQIDLVQGYPAMDDDVSYARTEDAGPDWKKDDSPTPGKSNK